MRAGPFWRTSRYWKPTRVRFQHPWTEMMNPKEDAEVLLNAVLAVAETMLSQHGEGGYR